MNRRRPGQQCFWPIVTMLALACCLPASAVSERRLCFDEICVIPKDGDSPAWVELWNADSKAVDLKGFSVHTLQGKVFEFRDPITLPADERMLLLFYRGKEPSKAFEADLPADVTKLRLFGTDVFPQYTTWEDVLGRLPDRTVKGLRSMSGGSQNRFEALVLRHAVRSNGATLYRNEVALLAPTGEIVAYAAWGDYYLLRETEAAEKSKFEAAVEAGLMTKALGGRIPFMLGQDDAPGSTVQMYAPFRYKTLDHRRIPSPGLPQPRTAIEPALKLPVVTRPEGIAFNYNHASDSDGFEQLWGWRPPKYEITYDKDMERHVFKPGYLDSRKSWTWGLYLQLNPVDFSALCGVTMYCRLYKEHKNGEKLYSPVYHFTVEMSGADWFREEMDTSSKVTVLNPQTLSTDRQAIGRLLTRCQKIVAEINKAQKSYVVTYRVRDQGREVFFRLRDSYRRRAMTSVEPFRELPVRELDISGARVSDLSPLSGMPLENLNIAGTKVTDISPLSKCPLKVLNVTGTAITNLDLVAKNPGIKIIQ